MNTLFLYGGISHLSFALVFLKYIKKILSKKNILLLGHIFIGTTFLIRSFPNYENNYITGIIGHSLILTFFILRVCYSQFYTLIFFFAGSPSLRQVSHLLLIYCPQFF